MTRIDVEVDMVETDVERLELALRARGRVAHAWEESLVDLLSGKVAVDETVSRGVSPARHSRMNKGCTHKLVRRKLDPYVPSIIMPPFHVRGKKTHVKMMQTSNPIPSNKSNTR